MLWGEVLSEYVLGDGGGELGGCGFVGVGVEKVADEGHCCLMRRCCVGFRDLYMGIIDKTGTGCDILGI